MARYTVELRSVVEAGIPIFDFPYKFYDEKKKADFEKRFIHHFYFREIGAETVDRFKWYLQDKMNTVFPYYNELFNTAQIEYNILDNYNIKEEYTIERENKGKTAGVSSTVGRVEDTQNNEINENIKVDGEINTTNDITQNSSETGAETVETSTRETVDANNTLHNVKKYLDTPQGKLDLNSTDYLTNLTDDSGEGTNNSTREGSGSSDTDRTKSVEGSEEQVGKTTSDNETDRTSTTVFTAEQKNTQDNNTRSEMQSEQVERSVYTKKGNIGVDTDADMIQKHINLQQILMKIELMFFDECEDLFMMVY